MYVLTERVDLKNLLKKMRNNFNCDVVQLDNAHESTVRYELKQESRNKTIAS